MDESPLSRDNEEIDRESQNKVFLGLPDIFVERGAHIAHFFRGEEERWSVLLPFIRAGINAGDQCCLFTEDEASPMIQQKLKEFGVDVQETLASGQLMVSEGGSNEEEMSTMFDGII